jgi:hypothetical protein
MVMVLVFMVGCSSSKVIDGKKYKPYGLINEDDRKDPDIEYDLVFGNLVWTVLLCETIVAPIYFIGFDLFEPIGKKEK